MKHEYAMQLTAEEKSILDGVRGETMRRALESVVLYGQPLGPEGWPR